MIKRRVEDAISNNMQDLPNLLKAGDAEGNRLEEHSELLAAIVGPEDLDGVCGMYVNSSRKLDCVVIADKGLHIVEGTKATFIPYNAIEAIVPPNEEDVSVDLVLANGHFIAVPMTGNTDGESDVFPFHEFLLEILPFKNEVEIFIEQVTDSISMTEFVRQRLRSEVQWGHLQQWLGSEWPNWITHFQLDASMINNPDFWRAVSLFVVRPNYESEN